MADKSISEIILESIDYGIDKKINDMPFDRTLLCTVTSVNGSAVTLTNGGTTYQVTMKNNFSLNVMDKVHLRIPSNNIRNKYLEEDISGVSSSSSSGSYSGTISASQVQGLTAFITNVINSSGITGGGTNIEMNTNIPSNQNPKDIWYEKIN